MGAAPLGGAPASWSCPRAPPRWCGALLTHSWWFWQACESCRRSSTWLTQWRTEKLQTSCPHHTAICHFLPNWMMSTLIGMWLELPSILSLYVQNYLCSSSARQQKMQLRNWQIAPDVLKPSKETWLRWRNEPGHLILPSLCSSTVKPLWHLVDVGDLRQWEASPGSWMWRFDLQSDWETGSVPAAMTGRVNMKAVDVHSTAAVNDCDDVWLRQWSQFVRRKVFFFVFVCFKLKLMIKLVLWVSHSAWQPHSSSKV